MQYHPEDVIGHSKDQLDKYISCNVLQEIANAVEEIVNLPLIFASWDGKPITKSARLNTFCYRFICKSDEQRPCAHCGRFDDVDDPNQTLSEKNEVCPSGLTDIIVPLRIGERTIAYLLTAQASHSEANRNDVVNVLISLGMGREQAVEIVSKFSSMNLQDTTRIESTLSATVAVIAKIILEYQLQEREAAA